MSFAKAIESFFTHVANGGDSKLPVTAADLVNYAYYRATQKLNEIEAAEQVEDKPKRTRKPKEVETSEPLPPSEPFPVQEAAPVAELIPTPVAIEAPAVEITVERKHVSAALITVAKSPTLGPTKAFEVLSIHGAKEVKDLKETDYRAVVALCADKLGKTVAEVLALDPTKGA